MRYSKPLLGAVFVLLFILLIVNSIITDFSVDLLGKLWAPVLLFVVSLIVPFWLLLLSRKKNPHVSQVVGSQSVRKYSLIILGFVLILVLVPDIQRAFDSNPLPTKNSDVLQQMEHLYDRFSEGKQPYTRVPSIPWKPFPVYMPMHWLPIGIGNILGIDVRWGGYIIFALIFLFGLWKLSNKDKIGVFEFLLLTLIPFAYFKYTLMYSADNIHTVFEIIVMGYYLLLALGFYLRNHMMIIIALICVMLSRYTIVFILPLLMLILYHQFGWKMVRKYIIWGGSAFLVLYVLPFLIREPSILQDGLEHHNKFAEAEYGRLFESKLPAILNDGSSFMLIAKNWWQIQDPAEGVKAIRLFQVIMSGLLTVGLACFYWFNRKRIDVFDFFLAITGLYLIFFYCTAPFAYGYYWMGFHSYLWIVCLRIWKTYEQQYLSQKA